VENRKKEASEFVFNARAYDIRDSGFGINKNKNLRAPKPRKTPKISQGECDKRDKIGCGTA